MTRSRTQTLILVIILALALGSLASCSQSKKEKKKKSPSHKAELQTTKAREENPIAQSSEQTTQETPPQIVDISLSPALPVTGDTIKAKVKVDDAHADNITLKYKWFVNGEPVDGSGPVLNYKVMRGDRVEVRVIAISDNLKSKEVAATTIVGNAPPILKLQDQKIVGNEYIATLKVKDPEGDPVTLELKKAPPGMILDETNKVLKWNLADIKPGTHLRYDIEVSAKDDSGAETILMYPLNIEVKNVAKATK